MDALGKLETAVKWGGETKCMRICTFFFLPKFNFLFLSSNFSTIYLEWPKEGGHFTAVHRIFFTNALHTTRQN